MNKKWTEIERHYNGYFSIVAVVLVPHQSSKLVHYHPAFYAEEMDTTHRVTRGTIMQKDKETKRLREEKGLLWGRTWEKVKCS